MRVPDLYMIIDAILLSNKIKRSYPYTHFKDNSSICPRCKTRYSWNHGRRHYNRPSCHNFDTLKTEGYIRGTKNNVRISKSVQKLLCILPPEGQRVRHVALCLLNGTATIRPVIFDNKIHIDYNRPRCGISYIFTGNSSKAIGIILGKLDINYRDPPPNFQESFMSSYTEVVTFVKARITQLNARNLPSIRGSETKRKVKKILSPGQREYLTLISEPGVKKRRVGLLTINY